MLPYRLSICANYRHFVQRQDLNIPILIQSKDLRQYTSSATIYSTMHVLHSILTKNELPSDSYKSKGIDLAVFSLRSLLKLNSLREPTTPMPTSLSTEGTRVHRSDSEHRRSARHSHPRRRVMLAMEWLDYELNLGIAEYARSANWIIDDVATHTGKHPTSWEGDGIIALLRHANSEVTRFVQSAHVPVVDLVIEQPQFEVPRVLADNLAIGRTAAEHLISCGLHHLAFLNMWDSHVEQERMEGFRQAVESAGHIFHPIEFHSGQTQGGDSQGLLNWLRDQLVALPKPLGAMGQHDREAIYIIQACELADLRVPEQVAVVGSDNDPLLCELGPVPLSSVDNRRRDQGFRAATLLDSLISGQKPPTKPIRVPSEPVMVRYSSEVLAVPDPDLSKALRYIADNYRRQSISVQEVVRHVDITRRRLYSLFEEHLGRPIHAEILRRRLDPRPKRLLLTTRENFTSSADPVDFRALNNSRESSLAKPESLQADIVSVREKWMKKPNNQFAATGFNVIDRMFITFPRGIFSARSEMLIAPVFSIFTSPRSTTL